MVKYTLNHLEKGLIEYVDHKRYLWLMSIMLPVIPLGAIALYFQTHQGWLLAMPLLVLYGVIPIVDLIVGEDENNPPEAIVPQLESDNYYRWLTIATVPLHFFVLIVIACGICGLKLVRSLVRIASVIYVKCVRSMVAQVT